MPKPKLHIGVVTTYPPGSGSLNEYGYHFVRSLCKKEEVAQVTLFTDLLPAGQAYTQNTPASADAAETSGNGDGEGRAPLHFAPCWQFNNWSNFFTIARSVRAARPDVVIFNIQFASFGDRKVPGAVGLLTPLLLRLLGTPTVVLLHNIMETVNLKNAGFAQSPLMERVVRFVGWLITNLLLGANLVVVTIPKYVEILEKRYRAKNVLLAPHGAFEQDAAPPNFELPSGPLQIMTFGKFGTYKKIETLIEAFRVLQKAHTNPLELVIAGTNSPNSPQYLESVARQYKDVPNVRYTGYIAEEDVPRIFGNAAAVVFPYTSTTGSSGVLHQAGDYGKAVVLPRIGDLAELIADEGYTGEFFEPENVESLAEAIGRIIDHPERRIEMGRRNYLAARGLPLEEVVDWYLLHIETLLKNQ